MVPSPRARVLSRIAAVSGWSVLAALIALSAACGDDANPDKRSTKRARDRTDAGERAADGGGGPLCPDGRYEGSLYLETQEHVEALQGCTRVTGDLIVSSESISNLRGLESLAIVEGTLQIGPTWSGEMVGADTQFDEFNNLTGLENLRRAGALLLNSLGVADLEPLAHLETAPHIEIVNLDGLDDLRGLGRVRWKSARIVQNDRLRSLEGLRVPETASLLELTENRLLGNASVLAPLRAIDRLILEGLPALASLDGLQDLEQIHSELRISNCHALRDLSGLGAVAPTLIVADNAELSSLLGRTDRGSLATITVSNLPKLETLEGLLTTGTERLDSLMLMQLPMLTTLADLSPLREVGDLTIYTCTALTNVDGLENLQALRSLTFVNALRIENLNGLANLERVDAGLYLSNAPQLSSLRGMAKLERTTNLVIHGVSSLEDLSGLERLTELEGVEIAANSALASLTGLERLTRISTLLIANNESLASLDGLSGLATVEGMFVSTNESLRSLRALTALASAHTLTIQGNLELPECEVEWLAERVNLPAPRGQNGPAGACTP